MRRISVQAVVWVGLLVLPPFQVSVAQLQSSTSSQSGSAGPMVTTGAQPDAVVINELEFKIDKLVRNEKQNTLRVILHATDRTDPGRWVSFVQPQASMIDDMGNQWVATTARGVRICGNKNNWDLKPAYCVPGNQYGGDDATQLTPNLSQITVIEFAPADGGVIEETLSLATKATMTARLMVAKDKKDWELNDITIPGIALPK